MFAPKRILVPTDFSEFSDMALKKAVELAKQHNATIFLLHVIDKEIHYVGYYIPPEYAIKLEKESAKISQQKLRHEVNMISSSKNIDIEFDVKTGVPYEEILKAQEDKKIDLIVISSHGRTGILRHLIGSVAEKVIRGSKCSVLLVKE